MLFSHLRVCCFTSTALRCPYMYQNILYRGMSAYSAPSDVVRAYKVLNLPLTCKDQKIVKSAYVELAKLHHPDASADKAKDHSIHAEFIEIQHAFKTVTNFLDKDSMEQRAQCLDDEEIKSNEKDIRHSAPQHRQFLEYGGVGYGTPSQRQRQYQKHRFQKGIEAAHDFRIQKHLADEGSLIDKDRARDVHLTRQFKTSNAIERVVEDMIQESMMNGEFRDLPGSGKPLKPSIGDYNPYVDRMTHRLNKVLVENGFTPEWISLEKEIRQGMREIRTKFARFYSPAVASSPPDTVEFERKRLEEEVESLNARICKFNLIVPSMHRQIIPLVAEREFVRGREATGSEAAGREETVEEVEDVPRKRDERRSRWTRVLSSLVARVS